MAGSFVLWKPYSDGGLNPGGTSLIVPQSSGARSARIVRNGQTVETLQGGQSGHEGIKFYSRKGGSAYGNDFQVVVDTPGGQQTFNIPQGGSRYEGGWDDPNLTFSNKGSSGGFGGGGFGGAGGVPFFPGGGSNGIASLPFYLGGQYPTFNPISFPSTQTAPFEDTDVFEFAEKFGDLNRSEIRKNYDEASRMSLDTLDTELGALKKFVPQASEIARSEIGKDNTFNQAERSRQIDEVLPNARGDLSGQRERALSYAEGRVPDEVIDNALTLNTRGNAADQATYSGFGPGSGQGRKLSDLMNAESRIQLSQYGDQLLTNNLGTSANLLLAPTEYSQAGSQVRINPSLSPSQLIQANQGSINSATLTSPSSALSAEIGQNQFITQLETANRQFNASGQFSADQYNSSGQFSADLGKFNYDVGYASQLQAGSQANLNFAAAMQMQGLQSEGFGAGFDATQSGQSITAGVSGIGLIPGAIQGISSILGGTSSAGSGVGAGATSNVSPNVGSSGSSPSIDGGSVGQTTAVSPTGTPQVAPLTDSTLQLPSFSNAPGSTGIDSSSPGTFQFASGTPVPQGFAPVSSGSNGGYTAANIDGYKADLDRFSKSIAVQPTDISTTNAALADRILSSQVGLHYAPVPRSAPIALTSSGGQVYSGGGIASSGDVELGSKNLVNTQAMMALYGETDPSAYETLAHFAGKAGDPNLIQELDQTSATGGPGETAAQIVEKVFKSKPDPKTDAGQQALFMAGRVGDVWGGLSPAQKSQAIASLAVPSTQHVGDKVIPSTEGSVAGGLRVKDALAMTGKGVNGLALARNWNSAAAASDIVLGNRGVTGISSVAKNAGMLGYGPQGGAVYVEPEYLSKMGARPAPEMGVGAVVFDSPDYIPPNYSLLTTTPEGKSVAIPSNLKATSPFAGGGNGALTFAKMKDIAAGGHPALGLWGDSPTDGVIRGSAGGSAVVSSLTQMLQTNPSLVAGMTAYSLFQNTLGA